MLLLRPRDGVIDAGRRERRSVLQRGADRSAPRTSARPQLALYGAAAWRSSSACSSCVVRPPAAAAARTPRRPVLAGAAAGAALRRVTQRRAAAACARSRASGRGDVGLVTQSWAGWAGDLAKGVGDRRRSIAGAGGALAVVAAAPLRRGAGGCPASGVVVAFGAVIDLRGPDRPRPAVQPLRAAAAGEPRADVLDLAGAPASTSARSTWWTRAGARPRRTPT